MSNKKIIIFVIIGLMFSSWKTPELSAQSTTVNDKMKETRKNWDELMHYTLIGKWDLAKSFGQALINSNPDPVQLLNLSQSERYAASYRNLSILQVESPLKEIAAEILDLVEEGRYLQRTDSKRITDEIKRLSSTTRGRMLAIKRLQDSGEWAVPFMIQALRDPGRSDEYANIRWALPQLGVSAVNPLVVALKFCDELNIRLVVLETLSKIGYKSTLAYIQEMVEIENIHPELKTAGLKAISEIVRNDNSSALSAAKLYEQLAEDYYNHSPSLQLPANQDYGNIWFWDNQEGLTFEQVAREVFDELMVMRCCEHAVKLNPSLGGAVSLWLSAFFRLEAEGFSQPGYFEKNHPDAETYALTAGPEYLHRVLARALKNRNRFVALSAIDVLQRNSGQKSLLYELGTEQPLITALRYPDREVRFSAALAIGGVKPHMSFEHSNLVMPILAEALQQKGQKTVLVVDKDQQRRNQLVGDLKETNTYSNIITDEDFSIAVEVSRNFASIDLIVLAENIDRPYLQEALSTIQENYRLAFCPTIIIADIGSLAQTRKLKEQYSFLEVVVDASSIDNILALEQKILAENNAKAFDQEKADEYAVNAANVIRILALTNNKILSLATIEDALLKAVYDKRTEIQVAVIEILAHLNSINAQRAVANIIFDNRSDVPTQLLALKNLAISSKEFGNLLLAEQVDQLLELVSSLDIDSELRNLAAEAYGSLNLPSVQISQLIIDQAKTNLRQDNDL